MYKDRLEQSPNWEKYKDIDGFIEEGFPFHEGFPRVFYKSRSWPYAVPFLFNLITRDGKRNIAVVDDSTQYRAEGLNWVTYPKGSIIYPQTVVAWNELDESEYPKK